MELWNTYGKQVDWKVFAKSDTACVFGLGEGTVANGAVARFAPAGNGDIRIAVKIGLDQIIDPRTNAHPANADLTLRRDGSLVDTLVDVSDGTETLHFDSFEVSDRRDSPTEQQQTLTTRLSTAVTAGQTLATAHDHEVTVGAGAKGSGSSSLTQEGVATSKVGVQLSGSFEDRVDDSLERKAELGSKQVAEAETSTTQTIEANRVFAVFTRWEVEVARGRLRGPEGQEIAYSVVQRVHEKDSKEGQYTDDQIMGRAEPEAPFWVVAALAELGVEAAHGSTPTAVYRHVPGSRRWTEEPAVAGGAHFTFEERSRDGSAIELHDGGRDVTLLLDFPSGTVMYRHGSGAFTPLYDIAKVGA